MDVINANRILSVQKKNNKEIKKNQHKAIPHGKTYIIRGDRSYGPNGLYFRKTSKLDYKQQEKKEQVFEGVVTHLIKEVEVSQTVALERMQQAFKISPFLRKLIKVDNDKQVQPLSMDPLALQKKLLIELLTRIKQGFTLFKNKESIFALQQCTSQELGDETYRRLHDSLHRKNCEKRNAVIELMVEKKEKAIKHWEELVLMLLEEQEPAVKQQIKAVLTNQSLLPSTEAECKKLIQLIPQLKLTAHPGISIMKPLFTYLSECYLNGDKLSSKHLAWLNSMVSKKLHTMLPDLRAWTEVYEKCKVFVGDQCLMDNEQPQERNAAKLIEKTNLPELNAAVDLFRKVLCDINTSTSSEACLGLIYSLMKFTDRGLIEGLLKTESISKFDIFLPIYQAQIALLYSMDLMDDYKLKKESELKVKCLLKTIMVNMARSLMLMQSKEGLLIDDEIIEKARTVLSHHNENLKPVLNNMIMDSHHFYDGYEHLMEDDNINQSFRNQRLSELSYRDYLSFGNSLNTVEPDKASLILPRGKKFRVIPSKRLLDNNKDTAIRRKNATKRDNDRAHRDLILTPKSINLSEPINWAAMDIPISFLFPKLADRRCTANANSKFNQTILPLIQSVVRKHPVEERQTLDFIKKLFELARTKSGRNSKLSQTLVFFKAKVVNDKQTQSALCDLLSNLAELSKGLGRHDFTQLLKSTACQLFSELRPDNRPFKRIMKLLYFIQSRSDYFNLLHDFSSFMTSDSHDDIGSGMSNFGNCSSSILKVLLRDFVKNSWSQPDDHLGERILQSVELAFKHRPAGCSYDQVMESFLESMMPPQQDVRKYTDFIQSLSIEIENAMKERMHLQEMDDHLMSLPIVGTLTWIRFLDSSAKELIEPLSELCKQFVIDGTCSKDDVSSATPAQMIIDESSSQKYLNEQFTKLSRNIKSLFDKINSYGFIRDENILNKVLGMIEKILGHENYKLRLERSGTDEAILKNLLKLSKHYRELEAECNNYVKSHQVNSIRQQHNDIKLALSLSENQALPSPENLQNEINKVLCPEGTALTEEDEKRLKSISMLRNKHNCVPTTFDEILQDESVEDLMKTPDLLEEKIVKIQHELGKEGFLQYGQYCLLKVQNESLNTALGFDLQKIKNTLLTNYVADHSEQMEYLERCLKSYKSNPLWNQSVQKGELLRSTLGSVPQSHSFKISGISSEPLNRKLKQQLNEFLNDVTVPGAIADDTSVFSLIGSEQTRAQRLQKLQSNKNKKTVDQSEDSKYQYSNWLEYINKTNLKIKTGRQASIDERVESLATVESENSSLHKAVDEMRTRLNSLLGNRVRSTIFIGEEMYFFEDAYTAYRYSKSANVDIEKLNDTRRAAYLEIRKAQLNNNEKSAQNKIDGSWLELAKICEARGIDPQILPNVLFYSYLTKAKNEGNVEVRINRLKTEIAKKKNRIKEHKEQAKIFVEENVNHLVASRTAKQEEVDAVQQDLFFKAFGAGRGLCKWGGIQHVLCKYLQDRKQAHEVSSNILTDFEVMKKSVPSDYSKIIDSPDRSGWLSWPNLPFHIISVPGAYPLIKPLFNQNVISISQLQHKDDQGNATSALIFAAAQGRYKSSEALMDNLCDQRFSPYIDYFHQLLTDSTVGDKRHLLHHVALLAKSSTLLSLLRLVDTVCSKQDYDSDLAADCLQNQIAMDKAYLLKTLLSQADCEGHRPTDLLLFKLGRKTLGWSKRNENQLTSFFKDFTTNDAKSMWTKAAQCLSAEQLVKSLECFMKGIGDSEKFSDQKKEAVKRFLKDLVRIFRVHGPKGRYDELSALITPMD